MVTIKTPEDVQALVDLALEIQELESLPWKAALHRAVELTPRLACDAGLTYWPVLDMPAILGGPDTPIAVHTSWSVQPRAAVVEIPARVTV